jgi:hypothetical protein
MNEQLDRIEMKLAEIEGKTNTVLVSSEKVRKYMLWGFWITVGAILIPLLLFPLVLPSFLQSLALPAF